MRFTRPLLQSFWRARQKSFGRVVDEWLLSTWGRRFRFGLLGATITVYPVSYLILNGPLLRRQFKRHYDLDEELPPHLRALIAQEYETWLENEGRKEKDANVYFYLQKQFDDIDTIGAGSMGVRFGAHIALPAYARFKTTEEAKQYCVEKLEPLKILGNTVCILWDSEFGRELIDTFVLSDKAIRFLIYRDLLNYDGFLTFSNKPLFWAAFTFFSSLLTYTWHMRRPNPTAKSFAFWYIIFTSFAIYCAREWYRGNRCISATHADSTLTALSAEYTEGGLEYYVKLLKRNQLLRSVLDNGEKIFTPAGDRFGLDIPYISRYTGLKDLARNHSELSLAVEGDVF